MHNKSWTVLNWKREIWKTVSRSPDIQSDESWNMLFQVVALLVQQGYFYQTVHKTTVCVSQSDKLAALFMTHFLKNDFSCSSRGPGVEVWHQFDSLKAVIFPFCTFIWN